MLFLSLKDPKKLHKMHSVKVASSPLGARRHVCNALILHGGMARGWQREKGEAFPPKTPSWERQGPSTWGNLWNGWFCLWESWNMERFSGFLRSPSDSWVKLGIEASSQAPSCCTYGYFYLCSSLLLPMVYWVHSKSNLPAKLPPL